MILSIFTSRLAGPISSAFALLFLVLLLATCGLKSAETRRADKLDAEINKPISGYKDQLRQCVTNRHELEGKIAVQNAAVDGLKAEASLRTAAAEKAVTDALRGRESAEARAAKLLRNPPAGIDTCARAMSAFDAVKESVR